MNKLIILSFFLVSTSLGAQTAKDLFKQLNSLQDLKLDPICETCEAQKRAEAAPSNGPYSPQDALRDINSGKLTFMGRDLFPGSDQNRSCVYKSDKAYIIYNNCMSSKKEAPATDIEVISFDGGVIRFYIENNGSAPISTLPRSSYDSAWNVAFTPSTPIKNATINDLKAYKERFTPGKTGGCYVGDAFGARDMSTKGKCYGGYTDSGNWLPGAESFWREPGDEWLKTKQLLRKTVVETKF